MLFKEEYLKYFPMPPGEYKFQLMASTDNDWKAIVSMFMRRIVEWVLGYVKLLFIIRFLKIIHIYYCINRELSRTTEKNNNEDIDQTNYI